MASGANVNWERRRVGYGISNEWGGTKNLVSVIETANCVSFFFVVFWQFDDVLEFRYRMLRGILPAIRVSGIEWVLVTKCNLDFMDLVFCCKCIGVYDGA
jgi:hypothetical protein